MENTMWYALAYPQSGEIMAIFKDRDLARAYRETSCATALMYELSAKKVIPHTIRFLREGEVAPEDVYSLNVNNINTTEVVENKKEEIFLKLTASLKTVEIDEAYTNCVNIMDYGDDGIILKHYNDGKYVFIYSIEVSRKLSKLFNNNYTEMRVFLKSMMTKHFGINDFEIGSTLTRSL